MSLAGLDGMKLATTESPEERLLLVATAREIHRLRAEASKGN